MPDLGRHRQPKAHAWVRGPFTDARWSSLAARRVHNPKVAGSSPALATKFTEVAMIEINEIFMHCSATNPKADIDAATIRKWHKDRGWRDIGYHYVIKRDGTLETGRPLTQTGAHAKGHNRNSIGICMVGGVDTKGRADSNFTRAQWKTAEELVEDLTKKYPNAKVRGHREVSSKACPSFDAEAWWYG